MNDNTVLKAIRDIIVTGMVDDSVLVVAKQQPQPQGVPSVPTIFFEKLFDHRYGWPKTDYVSINNLPPFAEQVTQKYEMTMQISALSVQDPKTPTQMTASDLVNKVAMIFTSRTMIGQLLAQGISVLRSTEVRNLYFTDDRDRQEAHPSFDLVITYEKKAVTGNYGNVTSFNPDGTHPVL